jgi:GNAT superfamily N-acetyltransferase
MRSRSRPGPPTWPGPLDAGLVEAFAARDGVADANWRRRGIGSAQLETATRWAKRASVATLRTVISRDNWPMRQLAHKASARLDFDLDEILADIAVATATTPGANGAGKTSVN